MPYKPELSITGIQEAMAKNNRRIASMKPGGKVEQAVKDAVIELHRYAVGITHVGKYVGGGALKSSHRMRLDGLEGEIYIDPNSVSPRRTTRKYRPAEYGVYENERGGEHAFYDRTVNEIGGRVKQGVNDVIIEAAIYGK